PWQNIQDLLPPGESWDSIFAAFMSSATNRERDFISGAQYYYQCKDVATNQLNRKLSVTANISTDGFDGGVDQSLGDGNEARPTLPEPTEAKMQEYIDSKGNLRKLLHRAEAVAIALDYFTATLNALGQ
ncbi:hypothetical protein FRC06_011107, partial [Ceratobasidium sp. 370]